jgi:transcription elongation factor/antiterminator RfaH
MSMHVIDIGIAAPAQPAFRAGPRWYAVHCLSHREGAAAAHLQNQDFAVFFPRRRKTRRHARRIETVLAPFFPGYIFVTLDLSRDRWRSVNGTYGVASLVMQGDRPAPVHGGVIEALQNSSGEDGVLHYEADLQPGQRVQIVQGPFTEFLGQLDQMDAAGRVRVLLDMLGRRTPIVMPRDGVISA